MSIYAKRSLGQNFLVDKIILEKITEITEIENQQVLEVGPGTGSLTEYILKKNPKKFYVVEKDDNLAQLLNEKFNDTINIINDDILNISVDKISEKKFIVFGNLPYNISTEILSRWIINLKKDFWFTKLILMFQKEVAERIIADVNTSNYGRLSILSSWKLSVKKIIDIKPNSFLPRPKIDSSLLVFSPKENFLKIKDPKNLEMITKIFFGQRRKMIKKPFNQIFKNTREVAKKLNINLNLRPQNLSPETYLSITKEYEKLGS